MLARCMLFVLAVAAAAFPLAARGAAPAYDHVRNGSFESGTEPWDVSPSGTVATVTAAGAPDGSRTGVLTLLDERARVRQTVDQALAPGRYRASARLRGPQGARVSLQLHLASDVSFRAGVEVDLPPDAWTDASADFDVPIASAASIVIEVSGAAGTEVAIDAVQLIGPPPVPVPPTPTWTPPPATPLPLSTTTAAAAPTATASATPAPLMPLRAALRNGGFEVQSADGTLPAWDAYGGDVAVDGAARSGAYAARLSSITASTKWLHQRTLVDGGAWYAAEAWIAQSSGAVASSYLRVSWYASDDGSGAAIAASDSTESLSAPAPGYRYVTTGPARAPLDARSARVRIMLAPASESYAEILIDDVGFAAVPPPPDAQVSRETGAGPAEPAPDNGAAATKPGTRQAIRQSGNTTTLFTRENTRVVINEVLYDPIDASGEWVELYNAGVTAVDLAGWVLADAAGADELPSLVLQPGEFVVVASSGEFVAAHPDLRARTIVIGGRIGNGLGDTGDDLALLSPDGAPSDAVGWGYSDSGKVVPVPAGHSIERLSPGADTDRPEDFADNPAPSPGRPYSRSTNSQQQMPAASTSVVRGAPDVPSALPWMLLAAAAAALATVSAWHVTVAIRADARMSERLQKLLARAGHGSRRSAEALIKAGRVAVNGQVVTELGVRADPQTDAITVDGVALETDAAHVYIAMHKPSGYVTTSRDTHGRRTVMDLLPTDLPPHVFPVGRLDMDTEGLLIFTSDGELAHRLAHPRYRIEKEYYALVKGSPDDAAMQRLRDGVPIENYVTAPAEVERAAAPPGHHAGDDAAWLRLVIHEGRKRQVRLMCATVGHPVIALVRTRVAGVVLGRLERGRTRALDPHELASLRASVGLADD